jgi:hypothetical protein
MAGYLLDTNTLSDDLVRIRATAWQPANLRWCAHMVDRTFRPASSPPLGCGTAWPSGEARGSRCRVEAVLGVLEAAT